MALVFLISGVAIGTALWYKTFMDLYKPKPNTALAKAKCAICHVDQHGSSALNSYGKLLKGKKIDASSLKAVEKEDACKDGVSNIDKIRAGTLPGDPQGKSAKNRRCLN